MRVSVRAELPAEGAVALTLTLTPTLTLTSSGSEAAPSSESPPSESSAAAASLAAAAAAPFFAGAAAGAAAGALVLGLGCAGSVQPARSTAGASSGLLGLASTSLLISCSRNARTSVFVVSPCRQRRSARSSSMLARAMRSARPKKSAAMAGWHQRTCWFFYMCEGGTRSSAVPPVARIRGVRHTHTHKCFLRRAHFLSLGGGRPRLRALSCITSRACRFDCAHMRGLRCSGDAFSPTVPNMLPP